MKFTDSEMLFLNSIQDGKPVFGIELQKPAFISDEYIEKTIKGLKEKGLIEEKGTLKGELLQPAKSLELYKNADTYIFINHMRIAICNEKQIVVIMKGKEDYEFLTCETWEFLYLLISNSKVLNENLNDLPMPSGNSFKIAEVINDISNGLYNNGTFIHKYKDEMLVKEFIFFWNDNYIDVFDGTENAKTKINGQQARLLLLELFEVSVAGGQIMGSENEIELRPEEFEDFFKKSMDLIMKGSNVHELFKNITVERLTSVYSGKPFYQGESIEMMVRFYAYYTINIAKLNSFYSKIWEFLMYYSEQIRYSDEKLAKMIDDYMSSPKGGE